MILLVSLLKERYKHDFSLGKQTPRHGAINRQSRNLRMALIPISLKFKKVEAKTACQIVRFTCHFSRKLQIPFENHSRSIIVLCRI